MLKLKRFLKPFLGGLVLAIILLAIQAICELNLPNYMSKIVNIGIQQGGIEDGVPSSLTSDEVEFLAIFMDEDERKLLEVNYVEANDADANANVATTSTSAATINTTATEGNTAAQRTASTNIKSSANTSAGTTSPSLDLKSDISTETRAELKDAFGTATWTMINLFQKMQGAQSAGTLEQTISEAIAAKAASAQTPEELEELQALSTLDPASFEVAAGGDAQSTANVQNLDFSQLIALKPLLEILPEQWYAEAHTAADSTDTSLKDQSAVMLTQSLYKAHGEDMAAIEIDYIVRIGLIMLLITILSGAASVLVGYLSARIGAGVARDLRGSIYKKVVSFSHAEFDRFSTASLITRSTNDVAVIQQMLTMGIRMICFAPIMGAGGVFMAINKSVSMSWIIGVAVVVIAGIMLVLLAVVMPKFKIMQKLIDRLNLVARETLNGLMVVRAFSRTNFEQERFDVANKDLTAINLFVNRAMVFLMPVMMLFMNALTVLIIWVGAHHVAEAQMQVGDMMAYMQYVMQIIMSFMFIAMLFVFIPRASVSAKRINEVLETEPTIIDPADPLHIQEDKRGLVEFKDVCFKYEGAAENALCNISFVAKPGQTTAFIGSTGSGKSTIINLIPRFYDATSGEVLVGGVNVRDLAQSELRASVGYVPQKNILMAGTFASNIAYGTDSMSESELTQVADVAQALEFIEESESGFETEVSQGGSSVSGGQRQRLSIARALAVHPDIYLFDDSFSALDFKTDAALRSALASYTKDGTLIIVAQRISTIMEAEQIYVIDEGRIVGAGTHGELLADCEQYLEIATSQLSERELAKAAPIPDSETTSTKGGER